MASSDDGAAWRTLHPASVVVNLLPRTLRVLRGAWFLFLPLFLGERRTPGTESLDFAILMFFFLATVGQTLVHFLTLRYRVSGGRLEIRTGLLNRQVRVLDPGRIQNTEVVRTVLHKLAGLAEVRIETASGTEVEGLLSALTVGDAEALVQELEQAKPAHAQVAAGAVGDVVVSNDIWDLVRFGATGTRVGAAVLVMLGVGFDGLAWIAPERVDDAARLSWLTTGVAVVALVSAAWVGGVATSVLRHWNFELVELGGRLVASQGLFTRRRVELRLEKVQLVQVVQPLIRRIVGFGSVYVETAAARQGQGGVVNASTIVPVVNNDRLDDVLRATLPEADLAVDGTVLLRPHPRALVRSLTLSVIQSLVLTGLGVWWLGWWGMLVALLLPAGILTAIYDHRFQGWLITEHVLVTRRGFWRRRTSVVSRAKLQSLDIIQGPIQRRWGLGHLRVRVAGSAVVLPEIGIADAQEAFALLSSAVRNPK